MIALLSVAIGAGVIGLLATVALLGWGGPLPRLQRAGLLMILAGLVWAAIPRFLGQPPGLGDILMMLGLGLYVWAQYRAALLDAADRLDGVVDGKIGSRRAKPPTGPGPAPTGGGSGQRI